jgi:hypothetical protein
MTVLVLAVSAAYAGESSVNRVAGIYVCQSYNNQKQVYVSDVFTVNAEQDALNLAYSRFLLEKYHVKDGISCGGAVLGQMNEAQARAYQKQQWARNRNLGFTIVETGWKYTAAEAHFAHLCTANAARWTGTRSQHVFVRATDVIEAPAWAENELANAWAARIKETHPEVRDAQSGCIRMVAEDDAARQKRLLVVDQEMTGPNSGWELVHVPFSFTPSGKAAETQTQSGGGH